MRYKCHLCYIVLNPDQLKDGKCPQCLTDENLQEMCPNDTLECGHDVLDGLAYCPECGEPMCPKCGCHDVTQISRVTGYLQDVSGWNAGKQQELKDRKRYNPIGES